MTSELKRKRGPVDVLDTPKRAKSKKASKNPVSKLAQSGVEALLNPPPNAKELVLTNGINGDSLKDDKESDAPVTADIQPSAGESGKPKKSKGHSKSKEAQVQRAVQRNSDIWRLSESIGGRMINADPVFTENERFLILASRTTVNIYSTADSLLTRSIRLQTARLARLNNARIIAYCLSPSQPNILWVACADGSIYRVDWTTGAGADQSWSVSRTGCVHMTVASMESAERRRDVVFTTEITKKGDWRITANDLALPGSSIKIAARTIYTSTERVNFLRTAKEGSVIVAYAGNSVLLGSLRSTEYNTIDKVKYEFWVFQSAETIFAMDISVTDRVENAEKSGKNPKAKSYPIVDVAVGDVKGVIYLHNDLLQSLARPDVASGLGLIPRKLHWHRQEVHTVKFSLDGNYLISGGTETVVVLWQLDTGKQEFLPHMSSTIQNLVVSPSGSSYAIQLAENSAMVISTAELKPTVNIAGIQTCVLDYADSTKPKVKRAEQEQRDDPLFQRTAAAVSPSNPARLLLGVGELQEVGLQNTIMSTPFLQTFDLGTGYHVSRQALTRSNITNVNITPNAHRVSEPRVTHVQLSFDGKWMATVDQWLPTKRDLDFLGYQGPDMEVERWSRREVFLKFWQWSDGSNSWELVSRINAPHAIGVNGTAGRVLDLASDSSSLRFSTIGEDEIVRTWATKTRKRDGVVVRTEDGTPCRNWYCIHAIPLAKPAPFDSDKPPKPLPNGCVAFSEDGSILAAAYGGDNNGLLYFLDPDSGAVRLLHNRMYEGDIIKLEFLGQDLVTLSDRVLVYDVVLDEMRYSFNLGPAVTCLSIEQKVEMMHLALDRKSRTFAIALPAVGTTSKEKVEDTRNRSPLNRFSDIAVFHQDRAEPLLKEILPALVTALLPAVGSEGYLVLDSAAEIRTLLKKGSQAIISLAQSTSALHLDNIDDSALTLVASPEDDEEMEMEIDPAPVTIFAGDDYDAPVVRQQQLTEVFDIGPSFALPPMEEIFYQVVELFSAQLLKQGAV